MSQVLQCISRLELAQLVGTGVKTKYITHSDQQVKGQTNRRVNNIHHQQQQNRSTIDTVLSGTGKDLGSILIIYRITADPKKMATIQEQVGETSSQSMVVAVDRIFTGSVRLDSTAIGKSIF